MPQTPTISASGAKGMDSMFSSTISTSQSGGQRAASVARPSGGLIARLPGRISSSAQRKLQKVSGKRGLMRSRRIRFAAGGVQSLHAGTAQAKNLPSIAQGAEACLDLDQGNRRHAWATAT